jgi:TonB family protein
MRTLTPIAFILLTGAVFPGAAWAADAEGCQDLKLLPRLEGCMIQECSAKQHDTFETGDVSGAPAEAATNSLAYSCPVSDPQKMRRDFEALLRKAGYQSVSEVPGDAASPALTARKNSQWVHWSAESEDGASTYSLTAASSGPEKFKAEACGQPPVLKQCEVLECVSKSEDTVAMRSAQKQQTSLTGSVQTLTLACPLLTAAQAFSTLEGELKAFGFEILFDDREHPESGWITGRAGKKWVELVSAPEGESVSYALTVVPSAEVLTAARPEPPQVPDAPLPVVVTPEPVLRAAVPPEPAPASPPPPVLAPESPPIVEHPVVDKPAAPPPGPRFIPPIPILQVPIQATHDRIYSVVGDVAINLEIDVGEDGTVTKAELTGHITKDALKLESAALDAVSHWRFEPARQDGRPVAAAKIPVQLHFHGRPWRY